MDLSALKWVAVIVVVVGAGWLVTEGGANWVYSNATKSTPGVDGSKDKINEATLSRYGGYLLATFQYNKAKKFYSQAIKRFPNGANYWNNNYQLARCEEKFENWQETVDILYYLWQQDAKQYDDRVPDRKILKPRIDKIVEMYTLIPFEYTEPAY